jgi:hypothetical protein
MLDKHMITLYHMGTYQYITSYQKRKNIRLSEENLELLQQYVYAIVV